VVFSCSTFRRDGFAKAVKAWVYLFLTAGVAAATAQSCTTTLTGTVYAPNGTDPLPNVLVYVPTTAVQPFPAGVSSCLAQEQLVTGNPLVSTVTAADGTYTLSSTVLPPGTQAPVPLVIQSGKWRRQLTVPTVTACATTSFSTRMPQTHLEGDIPQIAVVTGASDSIECVLRKVGIQDSEFSNPATPVSSSTGRVNLYLGGEQGSSNKQAGAEIDANTPYEPVLMQNTATLSSYDMVVFACEGTDADPVVSAATQTNLIDYANVGGRVFGTHYAYVWLDDDPPFSGTALWQPLQTTPIGTSANINTTFADGKTLADWLQGIGATTTYGVMPLTFNSDPRKDQNGVVPPTQSWLTMQATNYPDPVQLQFTFDTPVSSSTTGQPTLTVTFANTPATSFLVGDPADTITINVANTGTVQADTSLTLLATLDPDLTATGITGAGWNCSLTPAITCNRTAPLDPGTSAPVTVTVAVSAAATLGNATLATVTLLGGGLGGTQCGRVLFNEYHVELQPTSPSYKPFPTECFASAMSPQEKLLEYDLFDLSNFIPNTNIDTGLVQDSTTTTLIDVVTPIFYGQIIADVAIESTSANNTTTTYTLDGGILSFYIDGVDTCDLIANQGGTCPPTTGAGYDVGSYQIRSCYQGDTDFAPSCSPFYTVVINPDPTSTTVTSSLDPSPEGTGVTFTATVVDQYATARGQVNFYDGTTLLGSSQANAQAVATFTTPDLVVGTHTISACLVASLDFLASSPCGSVQQIVNVINEPPLDTVTLLVSSSNPSVLNQNVTFTAAVATTGAFPQTPAGNLSFFDGTTLLDATTLDANGDANFSTSTLALGTHPITAVYAGNSITSGSKSQVLNQLVIPALGPSPNAFLLSVTPTSVSVGVGNSVSLTVTVTALPAFTQAVQLSCGNLPNEATCAFSQALVPPGGGSTTLVLTAAAPHACGAGPPDFIAPNGLGTGVRGGLPLLLLTTLGLFLARKRRRLFQTLALAAVLCALPLLNGCSGRCTDFGTQPNNYTFTVTGTAVAPGVTEVQTQAVMLHVHL
jgi:hypothetical protein